MSVRINTTSIILKYNLHVNISDFLLIHTIDGVVRKSQTEKSQAFTLGIHVSLMYLAMSFPK